MSGPMPRVTYWLEFQLLSDGLQANAVQTMPLAQWHDKHTPVFKWFSSLPAELRLKVWEYLIVPRIVGIACLCQDDFLAPVEDQRRQLWGQHSIVKSPIPVLLHVNRETRALALKHYELSFEWKVPPGLAGSHMYPPRPPLRSPVVAAAPEPIPQSSTQNLQEMSNLLDSSSAPHMSSYHDLLDPSPSGSSNVSSRDRPGPASQTTSPETTATTTTTTTNTTKRDQLPRTSTHFNSVYVAGRTSSPPRTWFNFDLDVIYLLGELEPYDVFGVTTPMSYFIPARITQRVRKTAVSFSALHYGETGGQQIFGALFHVVDRFVRPPARPVSTNEKRNGDGDNDDEDNDDDDDELFVCVTERDEWTHAMMGHDTGLVDECYRYRHSDNSNSNSNSSSTIPARPSPLPRPTIAYNDDGGGDSNGGNVIQNIWRSWYRGSIVTSPLASLRFSLIPQNDLEHYVHEFMAMKPAKRRRNSRRRKAIDGSGEEGGGGVENVVVDYQY